MALNLYKFNFRDFCKFTECADVVTCTESEMVGRTCLAPSREKVAYRHTKTDTGIGVSRLGDFARDGSTFGNNHTEFAITVNANAK
jgi:hypothetical protein